MTPKPRKSRARFFTVDDIEAAAERLQGCVDEIKGMAAAMRSDAFDGILKIDGGDAIVDAVQLVTAWRFKVEGVYKVQDVARKMQFPHDAEDATNSAATPKARSRKKA